MEGDPIGQVVEEDAGGFVDTIGSRGIAAKAEAGDSVFLTSRIAKNTGFLLFGQVIAQVSMAALGIYVARTFGETDYGLYSLALAFVGMFGLLFSMGTDALVIRDVAQDPGGVRPVLSAAFWLRFACFPLTLAVVALAAWAVGYPERDRQIIVMMAIAVGLSAAADLPRSVFQGLQRMELDALTRITEKVGMVLLVFFFVGLSHTVESVASAMIVGAVAGLVVSLLILPFLMGLSMSPHPRSSLQLLRQAAPLAASLALIPLYQRMPVVILSRFRPYNEVGFYNAAFSIVAPFVLLPAVSAGAVLPSLSRMLGTSDRSFARIHLALTTYALSLGLPLAVGLGFVAKDVVRILYGAPFEPATRALAVLSWTIPLIFLTTYLTNVLIAAGDQRLLLPVTLVNLAVCIGISLLAAPRVGYMGAAVAAVLTECVGLTLLLHFTSRRVKHQLNRKVVAVFLSTGLMAIGLLFVRDTPLWLLVPLGAGFYLLGLWATGVLTWYEIKQGTITLVTPIRQQCRRSRGRT